MIEAPPSAYRGLQAQFYTWMNRAIPGTEKAPTTQSAGAPAGNPCINRITE